MAQELSKSVSVRPGIHSHRMISEHLGHNRNSKRLLVRTRHIASKFVYVGCTSCRRHEWLGSDMCDNSDIIG